MFQSVKTIFREFFFLILKLLMLVCLIYMVLQQHVCGCVGCACAPLLVCVLYIQALATSK